VYQSNCWELEKEKFLGIVENLLNPASPAIKAREDDSLSELQDAA
jgi:hypothetical protein